MKRKLKEELNKLCDAIINSNEEVEIPKLYESAKELYEKLAVLNYIEEKLSDIEIDVSKNVVAAKFEMMANAYINENKLVPESSPHEEDIITPGIDTIKGMVSEMLTAEEMEMVFTEFVAKSEVEKNDKEWVTNDTAPKNGTSSDKKSLNDSLSGKELSFGLNDRLAFVKHLFGGDKSQFEKAVLELNRIDSEERSLAYIESMLKPEHNNWSGKEDYEERFKAIIHRKFS